MTRLRSCELSLGVGVRTGMGAADLTQSFLESLSLRPRARNHIDAAEMIRLICWRTNLGRLSIVNEKTKIRFACT